MKRYKFNFFHFRRSKHLYEVIYNRIISNLLLWSPSAPNASPKPAPTNATTNPLLNVGMSDSVFVPYSMAKSNINFGMHILYAA